MARWRLAEVRIQGFRRFREPFVLDLRDPLGEPCETLVLAGSNGSGKTTVLEAILFALGRDDLIAARSELAANLPISAAIELTLTRENGETLQTSRDERGLMLRAEPTGGLWFDAERIDKTFRAWTTKVSQSPVDAPSQTIRRELIDAIWRTDYFTSLRAQVFAGALTPSQQDDSPAERGEQNRIPRFKQRVINSRARSAFRKGDRPEDTWLAKLNNAWAAFHGHDGTRIDADVVDPESDDPTFDLFVFEPGGERRCSIDDVSSGEMELLAFAGTLVTRDFDGLLLIDEPELHLHPEWASQIMRALRALAPDAQIIAATHAAEPWDQAYPFERHLLGGPDDPRIQPDHEPTASEP